MVKDAVHNKSNYSIYNETISMYFFLLYLRGFGLMFEKCISVAGGCYILANSAEP